ncbi:MAG: hypothetical protein AAB551_03080 [Patescibacteria group bacterium]
MNPRTPSGPKSSPELTPQDALVHDSVRKFSPHIPPDSLVPFTEFFRSLSALNHSSSNSKNPVYVVVSFLMKLFQFSSTQDRHSRQLGDYAHRILGNFRGKGPLSARIDAVVGLLFDINRNFRTDSGSTGSQVRAHVTSEVRNRVRLIRSTRDPLDRHS